jgi:hypothetical protein
MFFDFEITLDSNKVNFDEGAGELTATIPLGIYGPTQLAKAIETQLTATGLETYTVVYNRSSRTFTISATSTFDLLVTNGTNVASSAFGVFGFTGADRTGASSYTGGVAGSEYITQFPPQSYVAPGFFVEKSDASVNTSPNGSVEVVSFGNVQFIEFDLLYITDIEMDGKVIRNNPTGVQDALDFLTFAINRGEIEFMPDEADVDTFFRMVLETTPSSGDGVGFTLKEETSKGLPGIYKTGKLKFRIVG